MAQSKPKKVNLGDLIEVPEGGEVVRPNGEHVTVTGGGHVASVPGVYLIDGQEFEVK